MPPSAKSRLPALLACLASIAGLGTATVALAQDPELVFTAANLAQEKISFHYDGQPDARVIVYGPLPVPAAFRKKGAQVEVTLENVDFQGKATSCELYLVNGTGKRPLQINGTDSFGSLGAYEGETLHERDGPMTVVDRKVKGVPFRTASHLRAMKQVMLAIVVSTGDPKIGRIRMNVVAAHPASAGTGGKAPQNARGAPGPIQCGDQTCSGASPICCLSHGDHSCKSVADCPAEPSTIPLGCTRSVDCPGERCCVHVAERGSTFTTCMPARQCPARSTEEAWLQMCETAADCPKTVGTRTLVECGALMYFEQRFCLYK